MGGLAYQFPFSLGGADETHEQEHNALLEALELVFDTSEGTELWCETYADATAITIAWACARRLANQFVPTRMLENLPVWEGACGLRPVIGDSDYDRRQRLAAKLRALGNNALIDILAVVQRILGNNFSAVVFVDPDDRVNYWPGINPGPPGFEWASNRCRLVVRMTEDNLSPAMFDAKRAALVDQLHDMLPAWEAFSVGVGNGFVAGVGILGKTLL